jgi:hypothetical protein
MKWKFATHKYASHKFASGRFAGLGVETLVIFAPSETVYIDYRAPQVDVVIGVRAAVTDIHLAGELPSLDTRHTTYNERVR